MLEDTQSRQCKEVLRKNNLNPIKKLGKGGFGVVYLVSRTDFNTYETQLFSVKCTNKKSFVKKPVLRRYLKQQITLLENLEHENIVKLIRTFQDGGWIFMIMQYCNLGNLTTIQNKKTPKLFPLHDAKNILSSVIDGLEFMHSKSIIHRDIKPENILLTKTQNHKEIVVKICDLGFAREAQNNAETFCGTTYYMAPQIYAKNKYDHKVDAWAIGVLFFTMIFGSHPFKSLNMVAQIQNKCVTGFNLDNIKMHKNQSISPADYENLKQLFKNIFQINPTNRLQLSEIKTNLSKYFDQAIQLNSQKISQKQTLESDDSSIEELPEFYIQQIQFIQQVKKQVMDLKFLTEMEELAMQYYLDKVCLSVMLASDHNPESSKRLPTNLIDQLKRNQNHNSVNIASNLSKINIKKFKEAFSSSSQTNFQNYKEAYRLVIGHAFYRAHKTIEDYKLKNQIKLKLFCCHVINRVFDKEHVHELFKHYYVWLCDNKKNLTLSLPMLKQWIQKQTPEKIIETVELINTKFYRKNK